MIVFTLLYNRYKTVFLNYDICIKPNWKGETVFFKEYIINTLITVLITYKILIIHILKNVYAVFVTIFNHKQLKNKNKLKTLQCVYISVIARLFEFETRCIPHKSSKWFYFNDKIVFVLGVGIYRKNDC